MRCADSLFTPCSLSRQPDVGKSTINSTTSNIAAHPLILDAFLLRLWYLDVSVKRGLDLSMILNCALINEGALASAVQVALYATLCKSVGAPFRFPGADFSYTVPGQNVSCSLAL